MSDPWDKELLGWEFGSEASALMVMRSTLEDPASSFVIGRYTIHDALMEYKATATQLAEARAEVERAQEAVEDIWPFVGHRHDCAVMNAASFSPIACDCGLQGALNKGNVRRARRALAEQEGPVHSCGYSHAFDAPCSGDDP